MHNIASIYRFNTPFLDIRSEKENLLRVLKNIKKLLGFDGMYFQEIRERIGDYYKISLIFQEDLGRMEFYYINDISVYSGEDPEFYLPVFKLDIFLNANFLGNNSLRKKSVDFLTGVFECFDGTNEKEFLIDINNDFYYTKGLFKRKHFPHYDFTDISKVQKIFEKKSGIKVLEAFILKYSGGQFILTKDSAKEYHHIHGLMLYFVYLVYLIFQNLQRTKNAKNTLQTIDYSAEKIENLSQIKLMKTRLDYVDDLNYVNFKEYKTRLGLFFKLF